MSQDREQSRQGDGGSDAVLSAERAQLLADLDSMAAGNLNSAAWKQLVLLLLLVLAIYAGNMARGGYGPWREVLELAWPAIAFAVLIGLAVAMIRYNMRSSAPDPTKLMCEQAIGNLRDRGLLRDALDAGDSHSLLPPEGEARQTPNRRLPTELSRIEFLADNYFEICEQRGLAVHGALPARDKLLIDELRRSSRSEFSRVRKMLFGLVADELRSGRY
ncbi:hypothetical protein KDL29_03920 [bacterium]|nr:hypothetical protein [bacterium]